MKSVLGAHDTGNKTAIEMVQVDRERAGQRIDNFLLAYLRGVPRSHVYRLLRTGQVRVNRGRVKPVYRLVAGDTVRIPPLLSQEEKEDITVPERVIEALAQCILFEDDAILVINKPSGIAVHKGSGFSYGVVEAFKQKAGRYASVELAHRLDRDTSGCLLMAKNGEALRELHASIRSREMSKQYVALLCGRLQPDELTVSVPLSANRLKGGERMVLPDKEGKEAETYIRLRERYNETSLVDIRIPTGRKHQIRSHAAHIGHPVAGDSKYGDKSFNQHLREQGVTRIFLHAASLSFWLGKKFFVEAPLPEDLQGVLQRLEQESA